MLLTFWSIFLSLPYLKGVQDFKQTVEKVEERKGYTGQILFFIDTVPTLSLETRRVFPRF